MKDIENEGAQLLSITEMAKKFHITSRTLRLYHDMELLLPISVDERTGYRYYSGTQFQRLEKILQMKGIGLSLKQIKSILDTRDLSVFEALLSEQIDDLDEKIEMYSTLREELRRQLNNCSHLRNMPTLNSPFIEFISKRDSFSFDIAPYDLSLDYEDSPWEAAVEKIRGILVQNNLSMTLLNHIACSVSTENLKNGKFLCSGAFIMSSTLPPANIRKTVIPSATYACMYRKYIAKDNHAEYYGLKNLIQFIQNSHFQIVGPYIGEIVAENSIFDYRDNNILVKMQIPVKITS